MKDKSLLHSELVGKTKVSLTEVLKNGLDDWFEIHGEDGPTGKVHIKVRAGIRNRDEGGRARKKHAKDSSSSSTSSESEGEFEAKKDALKAEVEEQQKEADEAAEVLKI